MPDDMRLLVETDIESGLRWGELTELRVKDLDTVNGILTVSRTRGGTDGQGPTGRAAARREVLPQRP